MKLHKLSIVAFFIWAINSLTSIRLNSFRPYFWAMCLFLIIVLLLTLKQ